MRLTWSGWAGVAGVAVFAALVALPATRWVVARHVLLARGEIVHFDVDVGWTSIADALSDKVPENRKGVRADTLRAILIRDPNAVLHAFEKLSDAHPKDAFVQEELGRYASAFWGGRSKDGMSESGLAKHQSALLLKAAARGEAAEPDNALFPLFEAIGFYQEGRVDRARAALLRAAGKLNYREGLAKENALLAEWYQAGPFYGYAFEPYALRLGRCPYLSWLWRMITRFKASGTDRERLQTQIAAMKLAEVVGRNSDFESGVAGAFRCAKEALAPPETPGHYDHPKDPELLHRARVLQARAQAAGAADPHFDPVASMRGHVARAKALENLDHADANVYAPDPIFWMQWSASVGAAALLALPVMLIMALGQRRWRNRGTELALPLVPPLIAVAWAMVSAHQGEIVEYYDFWLPLQLALILAAIACACMPRARRAVLWIVGVAILAGIVQGAFELLKENSRLRWPSLAPSMSPAWIISVVLGLACVMGRPSRPAWLVWAMAMLQVIVVATLAGASLVNDWSMAYTPPFYWVPAACVVLLAGFFGHTLACPSYVGSVRGFSSARFFTPASSSTRLGAIVCGR